MKDLHLPLYSTSNNVDKLLLNYYVNARTSLPHDQIHYTMETMVNVEQIEGLHDYALSTQSPM